MLTWWGITLDVVDTSYRGEPASVWRIHHSSAYRFASVVLAFF